MDLEAKQKLWDYLTDKLDMLDDNNFTARQIFDYVNRPTSNHAYDEYEIPVSDLKRMIEKAEADGKNFVSWKDFRLKSLKI